MASATWLRLLKLDLALLASAKASPPKKPPPRRPRLRLAAEQLEDRTLPSGGSHLLGPADHPTPTPPSQGPAVHDPPSSPDNGNGQGHQNDPPPHGPAAHDPPSTANNGNGQGDDKSTDPPGPAAHGPPAAANNGKGPGQNNSPPGPATNSQGNGNGQGEGEENHGGEGNAQPPPASGPGRGNPSPEPAANGQENDNGQGTENGPSPSFVSPSALASSGYGTEPAASAAEPSAPPALVDALIAEESIAQGIFAAETESPVPASPGGGPPSSAGQDGRVAVPDVGSNVSGGGTPLLIAAFNTPSGAFAAYVTGLQAPSPEDEFKPLANNIPINDLDRLFIEWWDDDQLLFPDALPAIDETLFPDVMPQLDDMLLPTAPSVGDDPSLDLERLSLAPTAGPEALGKVVAPAFAVPAEAIGHAHRFVPIVRLDPANPGLQSASAALDWAEGPEVRESSLRPYHIALGMMPFLVAFGYTPSSLCEHVHVGRQVWKRLRGYLRRKP